MLTCMQLFQKRKYGILFFVGFLVLFGAGFLVWNVAYGANKVWTGAVDNNWNNANNWSPSGVPGSGDIAIFDNTCTRCDMTINATVNVLGIDMRSTYTGTITHSTHTITVGASGWLQAGGTFNGGSGGINITNNTGNAFTLTNGTFRSTSGYLSFTGVFPYCSTGNYVMFTYSGGVFEHNNGTVNFNNDGGCTEHSLEILISGDTLELYKVIFDKASNYPGVTQKITGVINVEETFTFVDGRLGGTGRIDVEKDIVVGSAAEGGLREGISTPLVSIRMYGNQNGTYTYANGGELPRLIIEKDAGVQVTPTTGTTNLSVDQLELLGGTFVAPSNTIEVGEEPVGSCGIGDNDEVFIYSGGVFDYTTNPGGTLNISQDSYCIPFNTYIKIDSPLTVNNLILDQDNTYNPTFTATFTLNGTSKLLRVKGNVVFRDGVLNDGAILTEGNVTVETNMAGGTTTLTFTGSANQTYTDQGGNEPDGDITINKSGGSVQTTTNLDWGTSGQDVTIQSGVLLVGGSANVTVQTLTVNSGGEFVMNGAGNGSTTGVLTVGTSVVNNGNISIRTNGSCGGADLLSIYATSQKPWSGSGTFSIYDAKVTNMTTNPTSLTIYTANSTLLNATRWSNTAVCPGRAIEVRNGTVEIPNGTVEVR